MKKAQRQALTEMVGKDIFLPDLTQLRRKPGATLDHYMNELTGMKPTQKKAELKLAVKVKVAQPCRTLCDPMDCSPPVSSVHGIL